MILEKMNSGNVSHVVAKYTLLASVLLTLSVMTMSLLDGHFYFIRISLGVILTTLIATTLLFKNYPKIQSYMIIFLLFTASSILIALWGVGYGMGLLIIGATIFLSGVMLGLPQLAVVTTMASTLLVALHYIHSSDILHVLPNFSLQNRTSATLLVYLSTLIVFATISWIIASQIKIHTRKAQQAQQKLASQKSKLREKLKRESNKLREAQITAMSQLYYFAEVGQSSLAMLHELSNQLNILNLDIDSLLEDDMIDRDRTLQDIRDSMSQISRLVRDARKRIHNNNTPEPFNVVAITRATVDQLSRFNLPKHVHAEVHRDTRVASPIAFGNATNFSHIISILVNNAKEACLQNSEGQIRIDIKTDKRFITISVQDNGPGIPVEVRRKLFLPKDSDKSTGLGVGLYMADQIIRTQLRGKIFLDKQSDKTKFIITLPRHKSSTKKGVISQPLTQQR